MRLVLIGIAGLGVILAGPATAANSPTTTESAASAKKDRVVCRSLKMTGTRFKKRECKTWAEWERIAEVNRDAAREELNKPQINPAEVP